MKTLELRKKEFWKTFWEYFIPLFTLSTMPVLQIAYPFSLLTSFRKIAYLILILSSYLFFFFLLSRKIFKASNKTNKILVTLLLILSFLITYSFLNYYSINNVSFSSGYFLSKMSFWSITSFRYILLSLFFLCFPFPLLVETRNDKIPKTLAILVNSLVLPFIYLFFGTFDGRFLYIGLQLELAQLAGNSDFNNYLVIGDSILFNSLLYLTVSPNLLAVLITFFTSIITFLIGSRVAAIASVVTLLFCIIYIMPSSFLNSISLFLKNLFSIKNKSKAAFQAIVFLLIITTIIYTITINTFFVLDISSPLINNLESSRVWTTVIETDDISEDNSLNVRIGLFECYFGSFSSHPESFLLGKDWRESGCMSYIHSGLSILFDYGLLGFLLVFFIVYICFSSIYKFIPSVKTLAIFLMIFFSISLFSRVGVSYYLPSLLFAYSAIKTSMIRNKTKRPDF